MATNLECCHPKWPLTTLLKHVFDNIQRASAKITCWLNFRQQGLLSANTFNKYPNGEWKLILNFYAKQKNIREQYIKSVHCLVSRPLPNTSVGWGTGPFLWLQKPDTSAPGWEGVLNIIRHHSVSLYLLTLTWGCATIREMWLHCIQPRGWFGCWLIWWY